MSLSFFYWRLATIAIALAFGAAPFLHTCIADPIPIPITGISWCATDCDSSTLTCTPSPVNREFATTDRECHIVNSGTIYGDKIFYAYRIQTSESESGESTNQVEIKFYHNDNRNCQATTGSSFEMTITKVNPMSCTYIGVYDVTMRGYSYNYVIVHANITAPTAGPTASGPTDGPTPTRPPSNCPTASPGDYCYHSESSSSSSCCSWWVFLIIGVVVLMIVLALIVYQKKKRAQAQAQLQTLDSNATHTPYQPLLTNQG